jgi:hypothetical protein
VRRRRRGGRVLSAAGLFITAAITLYGAVLVIAGLVTSGPAHAPPGTAWGYVVAGAIFLVPAPLVFLLTRLGARRRRSRAVRAALGEDRG